MCHTSTASFAIGVKFDHTGITGGCAACHNGVSALGKPSNHIPTNLPCETCHASTVTFLGASFAHTAADTNCVSCHNNVISVGLTTPPHIPTGQTQCSSCHTNAAPSFTVYTMNHPAVTGTRCDACHNGSYTSQGSSGRLWDSPISKPCGDERPGLRNLPRLSGCKLHQLGRRNLCPPAHRYKLLDLPQR